MTRSRIGKLIRIIIAMTCIAVTLPACMSTTTSGHVNSKLREHGV